jgi:hypothetical protein
MDQVLFITYAACALSGFVTSELKWRIDAFLRRMYKYGFCMNLNNFPETAKHYDLSLYKTNRTTTNCQSCKNQLLPPKKHGTIALRLREHNFVLTVCKFDWFKSSLVNHGSYNFI